MSSPQTWWLQIRLYMVLISAIWARIGWVILLLVLLSNTLVDEFSQLFSWGLDSAELFSLFM